MLYKILTFTHCRVVLIFFKYLCLTVLIFDTPVLLNYNLEDDLFGLEKSGKNRGISLFPGAQQPCDSFMPQNKTKQIGFSEGLARDLV